MDVTQTDITTPGQSESGNNVNVGVPYTPRSLELKPHHQMQGEVNPL